MSKKDEFEKNNANGSDGKFVFVDEGAAEDVYEGDNEQVVSISDDTFYQELAQDVLDNNVQNKIAKDSAAEEAGEGFDDAGDDDIPEISGDFIEEAESAVSDDDVIEISVGSDAYVNEFLSADSADAEEDDSEDGETDDEEEDDSEDDEIYDEEEDDSEDDETYDEEENDSEDDETYDEEEDDSEDDEIYDEEEDDSEDDETYDEEEDDSEDDETYDEEEPEAAAYGVEEAIEASFDEPENLYSVDEAEPAAAGKVDIMGYLSDEALSEIDSACSDVEQPTEPAAAPDMDMTQVYEPVSADTAYAGESGYVDIDNEDDSYTEAPKTRSTHHHSHHGRRRRRSGLKSLVQIASLLVVVAGLTWLISRVAFSAMGSPDDTKTSSDLFYGYSSNVTVISFDDTSDDDTSSEEEFNVASLSVGDKSDLVLKVQRALSALGYLDYTNVHGTYDNATKQAVKEFQKANGIKGTGVVEKATYYALFSDSAAAPTTVTTGLPTTTAAETESTAADETTTTEAPTATTEPTTTVTEAETTKKTTTTEKPTTTTTKKTTTTTKKTTTTTEKTTKKTTTTTKKTTTTEKPTTTTTKKTTTTEKPTTTSETQVPTSATEDPNGTTATENPTETSATNKTTGSETETSSTSAESSSAE